MLLFDGFRVLDQLLLWNLLLVLQLELLGFFQSLFFF